MAELVQGKVKVEIDTSATATPDWTNIPGVTSASYSGGAPRETDATDFDTPEGETETLYGAKPNPPLTFQMHLTPGDATQELLFTAYHAGTIQTVRLKAKTKSTTFTGRVQIGEEHSVDGKMTSSVSILPQSAAKRETVTP
ncbi:hypothetical protein D3C85_1181550 [compost metagenome]